MGNLHTAQQVNVKAGTLALLSLLTWALMGRTEDPEFSYLQTPMAFPATD
jgi:hypothetical protein